MKTPIIFTFILLLLVGCSSEEKLQELMNQNIILKGESARLDQKLSAWSQKESGKNNTALINLSSQLNNVELMNLKPREELLEIYTPEFREEILNNFTQVGITIKQIFFIFLALFMATLAYLWLRYRRNTQYYKVGKRKQLKNEVDRFNQNLKDHETAKDEVSSQLAHYTSIQTKEEQELFIRADFDAKITQLLGTK